MMNRRQILTFLFFLFASNLASAGDWPQILGPSRNGVALDEKLADKFPSGGPKTVWQRDVGEGYAGIAVAKEKAVLFHRVGNEELVEAHAAGTGKPLWKQPFPATYRGGINSDTGPRCTPLIHKDAVYVFGAAGDLHALSLDGGKELWSRAASKEFKAPDGYFGAGSTPIVEGDKILVNVGGKAGSGIVAFNLKDGETVWQATDELASYSSPVAATLDGTRHLIFVTRLSALSLDPANGKVRWRFPFGDRGPTVNGASPVVVDGHLFLSASYGIGAVWAKIGKTSAETLWDNNETMSSQYSTSVHHNGYLYGVHGRADGPPADLRCFDPKTGKILWSREGFGMASLVIADEKLVIVTEKGFVVLAEASPKAYRELGRAKLLTPDVRALPAIANGLLYIRDMQTLKCVDLRK